MNKGVNEVCILPLSFALYPHIHRHPIRSLLHSPVQSLLLDLAGTLSYHSCLILTTLYFSPLRLPCQSTLQGILKPMLRFLPYLSVLLSHRFVTGIKPA